MAKQHPNVKLLREYNRWRRGKHDNQPDPNEIGSVIDWAIGVCDAAEKLVSSKGKHAENNYARLEAAINA